MDFNETVNFLLTMTSMFLEGTVLNLRGQAGHGGARLHDYEKGGL
jgi:hypothetical protein